jgi:hypothetical protein
VIGTVAGNRTFVAAVAVSAEELFEKPLVQGGSGTTFWAMTEFLYPDTLRADIWIPRPPGGVCREMRLTKRDSMMDISADYRFSDHSAPQYAAGSAGSILNS